MADPLYYVLLPIIIFVLLNVVDQSSFMTTGLNDAVEGILCPMPEITGLWNSSGIIFRTGATYNYPSVSNQTITLTCTPVHTLDSVDYCYGCGTFVSGAGTFFYIGDYISETFYKVGQVFYLIGTLLQPPPQYLAISWLIPVFIGLYVMVIYGIYKLASPFVGG